MARLVTSPERAAQLRILIVDDRYGNRMMYSLMLGKRGHEVESVSDGQTAIGIVESFRPDIILLDIGLPGLNGFETCSRIRELPAARGAVIIALTGWQEEDVRQRADESGFNAILVKPVTVETILKCAHDLLHTWRQ